jgi:hypothetical protein
MESIFRQVVGRPAGGIFVPVLVRYFFCQGIAFQVQEDAS